jgi:hypothetical protein
VNGFATDGVHTLEEKHGRKHAPAYLVRDIPAVFLDSDFSQFVSQVGITQAPAFQFRL